MVDHSVLLVVVAAGSAVERLVVVAGVGAGVARRGALGFVVSRRSITLSSWSSLRRDLLLGVSSSLRG
jgi:hypothetical protein